MVALVPLRPGLGQEAAPEPAVTLELIMADPDWIGNPPERPYWSDDSRSIYFRRKAVGETRRDLFRIEVDSGAVEQIEPAGLAAAGAPASDYSADDTRMVFERGGDLFLAERSTGEVRQLTRTVAHEGRARFMADGRRIQFVRDGAILIRDLDDGHEVQPAELIADESPDVKEQKEKKDYLRRQQERLFPHVVERQHEARAAREYEERLRREDGARVPPPWYLGADLRIEETSLSPGGRRVLVVTTPAQREQGRQDTMPAYVDASGYVVTQPVREKVGTGKPWPHSLHLLDLATHERHAIDLGALPGIKDDPLADLRRAAEERKKAAEANEEKKAESDPVPDPVPSAGQEDTRHEGGGDDAEDAATGDRTADAPAEDGEGQASDSGAETEVPRPVSIQSIRWNRDGTRAAFQCLSHDNKDRWIVEVDPARRETRTIERIHDEAWVRSGAIGWLYGREVVYYVCEADGYDHLYLYDSNTGEKRRMTEGRFEVSDVTLTRDDRYFYFRANRTHPGVYEVFRVALQTGELERITHLGGDCSFELSPDQKHLVLTYSNAAYPPELYVQDADPAAPARRLTDTVSDGFKAVAWVHPRLVAIPSRHGRPIYARLYEPQDTPGGAGDVVDGGPAARRRPAVMFIHGAGYLQDAYEGWSYYFREFMFHTLLAQRGCVVLDVDYRASSGYGRDWRTAIYRNMGGPELEDLRDGVEWLVREHNVDRRRIGVYGGSYGGFLVLMALFREPDLFACGAALRPVTDWAHYNDGYTSNILNTPDLDPQAYERSSPIEFADGLQRPLLICHGMLDGNVLFQDTVRLAQRLIELEKENWEVAMYPIEGHAFDEPSSWLDEYRRVLRLFEENLIQATVPQHAAPAASRVD